MSNLIECIDCGNQVSKRAETCPKCGAPVDFEISEPLTKSEPSTEFEKEHEDSPIARLINHKSTSKKGNKIDPNRKLIITIIIIAVVAFGIFFFSVPGQKMFNEKYKKCLRVMSEKWCTEIHLYN